MKHVIKILFLSISIFFSLGFTTYQSSCGTEEIEVNAHSCCHSTKKTECTQSKDCKADCCLQSSEFYVLSQFIIDSEEVEKITVFESIKNFEKGIYATPINDLESDELINNYNYLNSKLSGRDHISLKQSWLI